MQFKFLTLTVLPALFATGLLATTPDAQGYEALSGVTKVAAGMGHTCAITGTGGVRCWGSNFLGQLGDGRSVLGRRTAADVIGLGDAATAISLGFEHTCALLASGGVKCWGSNFFSAAGGSEIFSYYTTPVPVTGLDSGIVALSSGDDHNCVLTTGGGVKCWGQNYSGQLGLGADTEPQHVPGDVIGLTSGVSIIAAAADATCALTLAGEVKCWGQGFGSGGSTASPTPIDVPGMSGALQLVGGRSHFCALLSTNAVRCWASYGTFQSDVAGLPANITRITRGDYHGCAITETGNAFCWGTNSWGQLGDGTLTARASAVDITANTGPLADIAAGSEHTCGATSSGGVLCWGANRNGQLGNNVEYARLSPTDVLTLDAGAAKVGAGSDFSCALMQAGSVKCWGSNAAHALGDGSYVRRETPVDAGGLQSGVSSISVGGGHTSCALTTAGSVKCWGNNISGQMGTTAFYDTGTAVEITSLGTGVTAVAVGAGHICAIVSGGGVKCMGNNYDGQLGDNSQTPRSNPVYVTGLASGVAAIAAGSNHTCATTTSGTVKCWGANSSGQLGDGTSERRLIPIDVGTLTGVIVAISASDSTTCAITDTGALKCWGANYGGKLGDGTTTSRPLPTDVSGMGGGVAQVSIGGSHACAVMTSGQAKCWGYHGYGALGTGSRVPHIIHTPVDVAGLPSVVSISAGSSHTCAVTTSGAVKCWGDNSVGAIGDGSAAYVVTPVVVLASDNTPDSFVFTAQPGVSPASVRTSNAIVVSGIEAATAISVAGGEYSIGCSGTFTTLSNSIQPNQSVCVRHIASGIPNTSVVTTLTIGMVSGTFTSTTAPGPVDVAFPDFNADDKPDLLWRNNAGTTYVWRMNGTSLISDQLITTVDPSWKLDGIADFNSDGHPDIVWRNSAGSTYVWYLVNGVFQSDAFLFSLPPEWVIQGVADFNADGKPDFLMRNTNSGNAFAWFFNNNVAIGDQFLFNIDPSWKVEGVGDLNADGQPDLLFRNTGSGLAFAWNTQFAAGTLSLGASSPSIFSIDSAWEVVQVADWNNDSQPDLLFRNKDTGVVFVWYLNGTTLTTSDFIIQIDPSWEIVPRR